MSTKDGDRIEHAHWPGRIVVGTATAEFEPIAVDSEKHRGPYRPDTLVDGWSTQAFTVRAASVRGDDHRFRGMPRQDDFAIGVHPESGSLVIAVADGVSAAPQSQLGAMAACRYAVDAVLRHLEAEEAVDWPKLLKGAAWAVVETAQRVADSSKPDPEAAEDLCGATLCVALLTTAENGASLTGISTGDSGMSILSKGKIERFLGGKTPTDGISSPAVVALPRVSEDAVEKSAELGAKDVLLVASDGVLDPLGNGRGLLGELFVDALTEPPDALQFCRVVDFSRETFDDDRTMVAVWPTSRNDDFARIIARRASLNGGMGAMTKATPKPPPPDTRDADSVPDLDPDAQAGGDLV